MHAPEKVCPQLGRGGNRLLEKIMRKEGSVNRSLHFVHEFAVNLSGIDGTAMMVSSRSVSVLESMMSAMFGRPIRRFGLLSATLLAAFVFGAAEAQADTINIAIDSAQILQLPERVATVVIGNPLIADASLQRGGVLVVTGKGYGATNLLALDRDGRVVLNKTVQVKGPPDHDVVVVYRGVDRESYSCAPQCEPRITLGDSNKYFAGTLGQTAARNGSAQAGGGGGGKSSPR
jgi:hypothetical protein